MAANGQPGLCASSPAAEAGISVPVKEIVERNLRSGRFQRVCNFVGRTLTVEEYTDIVSASYAQHHDQVSRLAQGEPEAWDQLCRRLFRVAYSLLQQRGWEAEQAFARAQEAAQDACFSIYCRAFTYDCPFDAWAITILRHHVFHSYHRLCNPLDVPEAIYPLGDPPEQIGGSPAEASSFEQYESLLRALGQLRSVAQRQAVECLFFEGLSPEETARKLNKTVQAVYNLKARALANLGALLEVDQPN